MGMTSVRRGLLIVGAVVGSVVLAACSSSGSPSAGGSATTSMSPTSAPSSSPPLLASLHALKSVASTVPANGDINPYGLALIDASAGRLVAGDLLVSNYNAKINVQGTGHTIVEISPSGHRTTFADIASLPAGQHCPGGIGVDTALSVLPGGYVVVGSLPQTRAGKLPHLNPIGCLIVLDSNGTPVATWSGPHIDGPWDMTATSTGSTASLYVSNVLARSGAATSAVPATGVCTIVRIDLALHNGSVPSVTGSTVIGSGFPWKVNPATVVLGPTGVAVGPDGTAYVANTLTNTITAIPTAGSRTTPVTYGAGTIATGGGLNQPLGLIVASNGDLIAVNGNDGNAVELTPQGRQVSVAKVVKNGAGALFGIVEGQDGKSLWLTDDATNTLDLFD